MDGLFLKACCAEFYEQAAVRFLLGEALRPGGAALTAEIVAAAGVGAGDRVLDVACGSADSGGAVTNRGAVYVGVDLNLQGLRAGRSRLRRSDALFAADAERLPFADASFDAVLVQCSFCTFPDSGAAAVEMARVLVAGGALALADVTVEPGALPDDLPQPIAQAACIAGALPLAGYVAALQSAGFAVAQTRDCPSEARDFLRAIDKKLLIARIGAAVGKIDLGGLDLGEARQVLRRAIALVDEGRLGYGYVIARKAA